MGVCKCSMFCCTFLCVHSSIAIILMGKSELIALLNLSSWCLVMVEQLFLAVPRGCLQFVIVVFPDHTHLLFFYNPRLFLGRQKYSLPKIKIVIGYPKTSSKQILMFLSDLQKKSVSLHVLWELKRTVSVRRVFLSDQNICLLRLQYHDDV